jgi:hypothetical protein
VTKVILNGEALVAHSEGDEPEEMRPWREAHNLIKEGKKEEAQALLDRTFAPDDPVPDSTLVIRVMLALQ